LPLGVRDWSRRDRLTELAVRALVFDVFGTLVDWRSGIARAFLASKVPGDPEELADAWRAGFWPLLAAVNADKRPWANFEELHGAALNELLAERGVDLPTVERARLLDAWHQLDAWPDVRTGLAALRRERVVAALSNGHVALLVALARHSDLHFDCVLSTELVHAYKPAPEAYLMAPRLLNLDPAEVMLVACHPSDLEAARRAGLRSALVERSLEYGEGSPVREDPDADLSIGDLHELAQRLSA
jgi:2-haloacid dehalogenase